VNGMGIIDDLEKDQLIESKNVHPWFTNVNVKMKDLAALVECVKAAEYGFSVRGDWTCRHSHPGPDDICACCKVKTAREKLGLK